MIWFETRCTGFPTMPFDKPSRETNSLLITISLMIFAISAFSQERGSGSTGSSYVPTMKFDVMSVRENKNLDPNAGITIGGRFAPNTTSFRAVNWDIENLISSAYGMQRDQIVGI